jgi:outer membrane protein assembly factor BamB
MILSDGSLYISDSRGNANAVDAASGATEWTWALPDTLLLAAFRSENLPGEAQDVNALDADQRAARAKAREARLAEKQAAAADPRRPRGPGPKPNGQVGRPVRAGPYVLVGDVNGTLYALDRFEGTEAWRWRPRDGTAPAGVASATAVAGRQIVFTTAGGRVVSLLGATVFQTDLSETAGQRRDRRGDW